MVETEKRMTADQALHHPWIYSMAASSSLKNLHGSISQNWFKQSTSRLGSAQSERPRSHNSSKSNRTWKSLSSGKHNKQNQSLFSDQGQAQSKVKSGKVETLPSMAEGVVQRQNNASKPSKPKGKLTARQVVEELYSVITDQAETRRTTKGNKQHPNGTGPTASSLDGVYAAGFTGKFSITEPNGIGTSDKNRNRVKSSDLEKQATACGHVNKRSTCTKVPIGQTRPVLRDNFISSETPHSTNDNESSKIQENICKQRSEAYNCILEPQSMSISRGNKISSA